MRYKDTDPTSSHWEYEIWECDNCHDYLSTLYIYEEDEYCKVCLLEALEKHNIIHREDDPYLFEYEGEIYEWYSLQDQLVKDEVIKIIHSDF